MGLCHHGSYFWRTDKAGNRLKYCRICDQLVHVSKRKRKPKEKKKAFKYTGDENVHAGACVHCGCSVHECECGRISEVHMAAVIAKLRTEY